MGIYDTIMLLVLGAATFIGWRKGIVSQVAAIVSLCASFFVATNFYDRIAASISAPDPWNRIAAFVIAYLGTSLVVWLFFRQVRSSVKAMQLGDFDRQMGALLGATKGVAIVTVVTLVAVNLLTAGPRDAIAHSRSGGVVQRIVYLVRPVMPNRVQEFLAGYVQRLDEVLGTDPGFGTQQVGNEPQFPVPGTQPPGGQYPPQQPTYGSNYPTQQPGYQNYPPTGQTNPGYYPPPQGSQYQPPADWRQSADPNQRRFE